MTPTKPTGVIAWLAAVVGLLGYEGWALATHHQSLSQAMVQLTTAWPPLMVLIGMVMGGLTVHFWWRWSPNGGQGPGA